MKRWARGSSGGKVAVGNVTQGLKILFNAPCFMCWQVAKQSKAEAGWNAGPGYLWKVNDEQQLGAQWEKDLLNEISKNRCLVCSSKRSIFLKASNICITLTTIIFSLSFRRIQWRLVPWAENAHIRNISSYHSPFSIHNNRAKLLTNAARLHLFTVLYKITALILMAKWLLMDLASSAGTQLNSAIKSPRQEQNPSNNGTISIMVSVVSFSLSLAHTHTHTHFLSLSL